MGTRSTIEPILAVLAGTVLILIPAVISGYPFVYSDTGTYLRSAFEGFVPIDRPYWYGPVVKVFSLGGTSLWGVAAMQAFLCALCIQRVCTLHVPQAKVLRTVLIACAALTLGTGLGWYAGLLIPDIFTAIGLLAVYALLHPGTSWPWRLFDAALIVAACWFHTSNLLILPMAGVAQVLLRWREGKHAIRWRAIWLTTVSVVAWVGLALANRVLDGEARISSNSHMFLVGCMVDQGMLGPYLDEHCATEHFGLCAYKDSLPTYSQEFIWNERSPAYKQGGWTATEEEYSRIVRGSFTQPRYLWWHLRGSFASTWELLRQWEICHAMRSDWYREPGSPPRSAIARLLPQEEPRLMGALQNGGRGELSMRWPDIAYRITLALSLVGAAWALLRRSSGTQEARAFIVYAVVAVLIAAWVGATFSLVESRFLSRDSWLLPLAVIIFFAKRAAPAQDAPTH